MDLDVCKMDVTFAHMIEPAVQKHMEKIMNVSEKC